MNPTFTHTSDFIGVLTESTILPAVANVIGFEDDLTGRRRIYDAAIWPLDVPGADRALPRPSSSSCTSILPRLPWVVDENGGYVTAEADAERTPAERYRTQWEFVDREMQSSSATCSAVPRRPDQSSS